MKHPKTWLAIALLALMLIITMMKITTHHNEEMEIQEHIYNHSEIKDTV
ncbi:MAG: hypothetical protein JWP44_2851 [Mucilaginibacter sp.]|nr:hypothetical protein [Mucilaginibacter sp.]